MDRTLRTSPQGSPFTAQGMTLPLETSLPTGRHAFFAEVPAKGVEGGFAHAIAPGGTRAATGMWRTLADGRARR